MPSKAPRRPQEPRSGHGWYMGSIKPFQRLVGPVAQTQTNVWELDRGVPCRVQQAGGGTGCVQPGRPAAYYAPACARVSRAGARARGRPFAPPPLAYASGGLSQFFPPFSLTMLLKENVNGY